MKKSHAIALYVLSLLYVFVGTVIYDWTSHMSPALDGRGNARTLFLEVSLIFFGLILFSVVFLIKRNKISGTSLNVLFYTGLCVILFGGLFASIADSTESNLLTHSYYQFLTEAAVLYAPSAALLFLNKVRK